LKPPNPPPVEKLFRNEVLQARSTRLLGQIILTPSVSTAWLSAAALLIGIAVVCLLVFGSYTRRATVTGQLLPTSGVIRVHTPQPGVVLEKRVAEGQLVQKGEVLFVLTSDRVGTGVSEIQADIGRQVEERKRSLEAEVNRNRNVEADEVRHLTRQAAMLKAETESIEKQIEQQKLRLDLALDARKRYEGLANQDYIAREQLFQKEAELSEQQSKLQALQREAIVSQRQLALTLREIENGRQRNANQNALLQRNISSAQQEFTEVEARRRVVITAPESGRATLVVAEVGQVVDVTKPLLNVVPENARLEARLYAPSRTIGFVRAGDAVQIRYQSFPFQKFGQYAGTVTSVSNNAVNSAELAGFAIPDAPAGELVYAITVSLAQQQVNAYGKPLALQAGMRLDADILQETRHLWEWMLEPVFSITGKM